MLTYINVSKVFADGTLAVDDLTLDVQKGECIVLIGPSGCGKTTTLKMANRLEAPTSGSITLEGRDLRSYDAVTLRRMMGYVIQEVGLFPHMTVAQNIGIVPRLLKWSKAKLEKRIDELLDLVNMDPAVYRRRYPWELSGGQQQRVGVLRALAADPEIVLMDEPFGALDPITRDQLQDEFRKLQASLRKTILFVTHDMDEALKMADRIVILRQGKVVQIGTPAELIEYQANEFVLNFIGEKRLGRDPATTSVAEAWRDIVSRRSAEAREYGTPESGQDGQGGGDGWVTGGRGDPQAASTVAVVAEHEPIAQILSRRRREKREWFFVVDSRGRLKGLLSDAGLSVAKAEQPAAEAADTVAAVVEESQSVRDAALAMLAARAGYVAVTDADGRPIGLLNRSDLLEVICGLMWRTGKNSDASGNVATPGHATASGPPETTGSPVTPGHAAAEEVRASVS